jgi:hypothetical protein
VRERRCLLKQCLTSLSCICCLQRDWQLQVSLQSITSSWYLAGFGS